MQTLNSLFVCIVLAGGMAWCQSSTCLQDQWGNQYRIVIDQAQEYIYGFATNNQACKGTRWPVIGAFVTGKDGMALELTAANPIAQPDVCVPIYTLKGKLPHFQWYYADGGSGQAGTWAACGAAVSEKPAGKGARK